MMNMMNMMNMMILVMMMMMMMKPPTSIGTIRRQNLPGLESQDPPTPEPKHLAAPPMGVPWCGMGGNSLAGQVALQAKG